MNNDIDTPLVLRTQTHFQIWGFCIILWCFSDIFTTILGIEYFGAIETNGLAKLLISQYGYVSLAVIKATTVYIGLLLYKPVIWVYKKTENTLVWWAYLGYPTTLGLFGYVIVMNNLIVIIHSTVPK